MTTREMRPQQVEAQPESPTKATASIIPDEADPWQDQLTRIESILDRILRSLAPMVGAR